MSGFYRVWARLSDIAAQSASLAAAAGSTLIGFMQAGVGAIQRTVQAKLRDTVSPMDFGGVGDGVADDTAAWAAALLAGLHIKASNKSWKITSTLTLRAGQSIDIRGASIVVACGATPVFQFLNGNAGLYIQHAGGTVTGTASCFLLAQGTTNQPTAQGMYASQIHIEGLWVSSATITTALVFDKAVKSVYLPGVNFFTPNGISASGKCVEVMISDSILFSATGAAGTFGIKLRSTGLTTYFNEGWSIVNSTVDNFEITHDITDVFVYQVLGGYHGCNAALSSTTGYGFQFQAPSTNLCEEISIGAGIVIGGRIRFVASAGGQAYNAKVSGFTANGVPGTAIAIENNASAITVSEGKFKGASGAAVGVVGSNNNAGIVCTGLDFDGTYTNGVVLNGAAGAGCAIGPLTGPTAGDIFGVGRVMILRGVPVNSAALAALKQTLNPADLAATYAVGIAIATQAISFAKGERGWIIFSLPASGMTAATQRLDLAIPVGMVIPSGTGWASNYIYPSATGALVVGRVPYYCTADGAGNLSITNAVGSAVTLNSHGYFGLERAL